VPITSFSDGDNTGPETMSSSQWREIRLDAQILRDLGVASIRNLATSGLSYVGLSGFGIELLSEEPIEC
jgi:3,4-dihydroxy 2-butanone 4-phosphate synthase/GTP cyclohydrolase II